MKYWFQGWQGRLAALLLMFFAILVSAVVGPAQKTYVLGSATDDRIVAGFWPSPEEQQERFRWSDGNSVIRLYGYEAAPAALVSMRITGIQLAETPPVTLTLQADKRSLAQFEVFPSWRVYRMLVTANSSRWRTPQLHLLSPTRRPGPNDGRDLGVAVAEVQMAPLGGRLLVPLLERIAFFAIVLSLVFWGLARTGRAGLAWSATLLVAALLLATSLDSPGLLALLLPPLWRLAFLLAAGLAAIWLVERLETRIAGSLRWVGGGLGLALVGQLVLRPQYATNWPLLVGGALLFVGVVIVAAALTTRVSAAERQGERRLPAAPLLGACCLLALALRLYALDWVPFGMWRDEARHGLLALRILHDADFRPVYVPDHPIRVDLPALLFYLQAGPIALLGPTVAAARLVSAVAGSLTIVPIYLLGRRLWGQTAGLAAALFLAVSSWHIALSRFASPAVLDPLFTLTALVLLFYALDRGARQRPGLRLAAAGLAGVSQALALYTYHTGRLMPAAAAALILYYLGLRWEAWRRAFPALAVFAVAFALVATPLVHYMLTQPEAFNRRISQIGTFATDETRASPAAALEENLVRYALMWNVEGEHNPRHHVPLVPLVDLLTGLCFVVGALLLLRRRSRPAALLALTLLGLGLLPGILSSDAPHALRSVDAIAPTALIAAAGAAALLSLLAEYWPRRRSVVASGALALSVITFNIWTYFGHMPYDPRVWGKFEYTAETAIGRYLQTRRPTGPVYMTQAVWQTDVAQYLTYFTPVTVVSPTDPNVKLPSGALLVVPGNAKAKERRWAELAAGGSPPQPMDPYPGTDQPTFWLYQVQ